MNRPHVTLKLASSIDGRIATAAGESRWITGAAARAEVHRLRAENDAVLVGVGTVIADDPELTARGEPAPARQPLRVVLDRRLRIPLTAKLLATRAAAPLLVLGAPGADPERAAALTRAGALVRLVQPLDQEGEISAVLRALHAHHAIGRLFIEGGGLVGASFLREGLVDRLEWFRAPLVLGAEAKPAVGPLNVAHLAAAPAFRRVAVREVGPDVWETYERC